MKTLLGLTFWDKDGLLFESFQLLNSDKKAVAIADFRDGKLEKFDFTESCKDSAVEWRDKLIQERQL